MKKKWPRDDYTTLTCMYRRGRRKEVGDASLSVISDADCSIRGTAGGAKHWIARQTGCDDGATFRALLVPRAWSSAPRGPQALRARRMQQASELEPSSGFSSATAATAAVNAQQ
jgi:hypothetical protein